MTAAWRPKPLHSRFGSAVRVPILAAVVAALVLAACDTAAPIGFGTDATDRPPMDRIHTQAHDALDRWATAVRASGGATISFVGDMTSLLGEFEEAVGGDYKVALLSGILQAKVALPDDPPSRSEVKWLDGAKIDVDVLSASAALDDLVATAGGGPCGDCDPLLVTNATLARGLVETTQGPAEAPLWVFTIEGTAARVTRIAVDDSITVEPPPWNAEDPPVGISIEGATGASDSRRLEVSFIGAVKGRDEPCGADYTAEAVESELAVVVIVTEQPHPAAVACRAVGRTRTADVRLAIVLGDRAVLEVRQGLPVPLRAP